jgi:hypothetical protein
VEELLKRHAPGSKRGRGAASAAGVGDGLEVTVGGTAVAVGGTGVAVGGAAVSIAVGGSGVAAGRTGVRVAGGGSSVGVGAHEVLTSSRSNTGVMVLTRTKAWCAKGFSVGSVQFRKTGPI